MPAWYGAYRDHAHSSTKNVLNALLCLVALVPSFLMAAHWMTSCSPVEMVVPSWCPVPYTAFADPLVQVNVLYFFNVSVGFWLIGLMQQSFWVSSLTWTSALILAKYIPTLLSSWAWT